MWAKLLLKTFSPSTRLRTAAHTALSAQPLLTEVAHYVPGSFSSKTTACFRSMLSANLETFLATKSLRQGTAHRGSSSFRWSMRDVVITDVVMPEMEGFLRY